MPHLASHVLGQAARRLAPDWERHHGARPVLLETCVEGSRPGTSYKAANWECVGQTRGRPPGVGGAVEPKAVWLLGLEKDWERTLRRPLQRELGRFPQLEQMGQAWERHAGAPLPAIFPREAQRRAAVRLLHNGRVGAQDILQPHREALLERVQVERTVLLVQDTTTLNYTNLKDCAAGLGPLKKRSESARGGGVHGRGAAAGGERLGAVGAAAAGPGQEGGEGESALVPGLRAGPGAGAAECGDAGGGWGGAGRATSSRCLSGRRSGRGRRGCWCG